MLSERGHRFGKHEDRAAMEDGFLASLPISWFTVTLERHWHTHAIQYPGPLSLQFPCFNVSL